MAMPRGNRNQQEDIEQEERERLVFPRLLSVGSHADDAGGERIPNDSPPQPLDELALFEALRPFSAGKYSVYTHPYFLTARGGRDKRSVLRSFVLIPVQYAVIVRPRIRIYH